MPYIALKLSESAQRLSLTDAIWHAFSDQTHLALLLTTMLKQTSILSFTETNQRRTDAEMHTPYRQKHRTTKLVWSTKNTSSKSRTKKTAIWLLSFKMTAIGNRSTASTIKRVSVWEGVTNHETNHHVKGSQDLGRVNPRTPHKGTQPFGDRGWIQDSSRYNSAASVLFNPLRMTRPCIPPPTTLC